MVSPSALGAAVVDVVTFVVLWVLCAVVVTGELVLVRSARHRVEQYRRQAEEYRALAAQADSFVADMRQSYTAMAAERQASHESTLTQISALHATSLADTTQRYQDSVEAIHTRYAAALVRLQARQPPPKVLRLHGDQQP